MKIRFSRTWRVVGLLGALALAAPGLLLAQGPSEFRVATFEVDASPQVGSPLAYDPTREVTTPLSCRGIVLLGKEAPIVLCAIDWLGVANESQVEFRRRLAQAAGTTPERVAVHSLHQHDAPRCDFSAARLLDQYAPDVQAYDLPFARDVMDRAAAALQEAMGRARRVTQLGLGSARVEKVASNRRILGEDGRVAFTRWTACKDPAIRAMPVGVIDPALKMISFWEEDEPLAVLTYYATHPQSFYRTGGATPDFPGLARNAREKATGIPHIHFTGAAGNVGAGKWNDGSPENRPVLAERVADAMERAWKKTRKQAVVAADLSWRFLPVLLPVASHLEEEALRQVLRDAEAEPGARLSAAKGLAWLQRARKNDPVGLSSLEIGPARVLHMPGELFVEYQLAAQRMQPDRFVAMAAYGDYGPGYIGTETAYEQGGYETSERASRVAPSVEKVLLAAIRKLLEPE